MEPKFKVEFLDEAVEFIESLDEKTKAKIYYNIKLSQYKNDNELFKKLTDNIWEFRTLFKNVRKERNLTQQQLGYKKSLKIENADFILLNAKV
jgi:hypothetical protein